MTIMAERIVAKGVIGAVAFNTYLFINGAFELLMVEKTVDPATRSVYT